MKNYENFLIKVNARFPFLCYYLYYIKEGGVIITVNPTAYRRETASGDGVQA